MNFRNSRQRQRILDVLKGTRSHPAAEWIYMKLKHEIPGLSLGTVYRNLKVLLKQGQINKLMFGSTHDRFDGELSPHYHLVCERCGTIEDLTMPRPLDINKKAEELSRYRISRHRIKFFGICEKCQSQIKRSPRRKGNK